MSNVMDFRWADHDFVFHLKDAFDDVTVIQWYQEWHLVKISAMLYEKQQLTCSYGVHEPSNVQRHRLSVSKIRD